MTERVYQFGFVGLLYLLLLLLPAAANAAKTGILVVAPDRGFAGNEETRAAFADIASELKELVFITDEQSRLFLKAAVSRLKRKRIKELAVLPAFLTPQQPRWQQTESWLRDGACAELIKCEFSEAFGQSYIAIDGLNQAIENSVDAARTSLLLIGSGDKGGNSEDLRQELIAAARKASSAGQFKEIDAFVWETQVRTAEQRKALSKRISSEEIAIVSWHLSWKMDSMMSFDNMLDSLLRSAGDRHSQASIGSAELSVWMQRESNRHLISSTKDIGVVILAHGADFHWNETMRNAIAPLQKKYVIEMAFSMADRVSIANALARLEDRGVRGAVVVRVFGIEDSFRSTVEGLLGIASPAAGDHSRMHHGRSSSRPIVTPLFVNTVGGLDDHPLFAAGLLARAEEVSVEPANETIILTGHGRGDDAVNDQWLANLESLAQQMRANGGDKYRAIHYGTWREDWPKKSAPWVAKIREFAVDAQQNGGSVIIVPARTNSGGPAQRLLSGIEFVEAQGFAPHPLFTEWLESAIQQGMMELL